MQLTFKNYCLILVVLLSLSGCSVLNPTTHYVIDVWVQPKDTTSDWGIWEFFDDNGNSLYWTRSGHVEKEFTNNDNEFAKFKNAESLGTTLWTRFSYRQHVLTPIIVTPFG